MKPKISASILSSDFGSLNKEIKSIEDHVDSLHLDIMDGHFVQNITFGPPVIKCIKTKLPLITHLMINNPETYIQDFQKSGSDAIIFHVETSNNPKKLINDIKTLGLNVGVSLKPKTPLETIKDLIHLVDIVLVMTVEPGFGGQTFIEDMLPKIEYLSKYNVSIQVDGGINNITAKKCVEAGADTLISGSYIFKSTNRIKAINSLL